MCDGAGDLAPGAGPHQVSKAAQRVLQEEREGGRGWEGGREEVRIEGKEGGRKGKCIYDNNFKVKSLHVRVYCV